MPNGDFVSRQWLIDEYHRRHQGPPGGALKMIEEAPAADVEPSRRWIPVTERLPENNGRYLVIHPLHNRMPWITVMYFGVPDGYDKGICFYIADDEWGDIPCDCVTHWMPLPEPPKEGQK